MQINSCPQWPQSSGARANTQQRVGLLWPTCQINEWRSAIYCEQMRTCIAAFIWSSQRPEAPSCCLKNACIRTSLNHPCANKTPDTELQTRHWHPCVHQARRPIAIMTSTAYRPRDGRAVRSAPLRGGGGATTLVFARGGGGADWGGGLGTCSVATISAWHMPC